MRARFVKIGSYRVVGQFAIARSDFATRMDFAALQGETAPRFGKLTSGICALPRP